MYHLTSANRRYFINDKIYDLEKGDTILIAPYEIHTTDYVGQDVYSRFLINFTSDLFSDDEKILLSCFNAHKVISIKNPEFHKLFIRMKNEYDNKDDCYEIVMKAILMEILAVINRECSGVDTSFKPEEENTKISQILKYVNRHYRDNISLNTLSNEFSYSASYISKYFKRQIGTSLVNYVNNLKIIESQKLLQNSALNITEIALAVGFENPSHFSRVFKKMTDTSPLAYRKNKKQ